MPDSGLILLHSPFARAEHCAEIAAEMEREGVRCTLPDVTPSDLPPYVARYVAQAALWISRNHGTGETQGIVAQGAAGPLAPQVAAAQRAAGRYVAGYVLLDALLPQQSTPTLTEIVHAQSVPAEVLADTTGGGAVDADALRAEALPITHDWPDAPCGYVLTDSRYASCARLARLRGWPVTDLSDQPPDSVGQAHAVLAMHAELTA